MIDGGDNRRLEALRHTQLLDSPPEHAFDRLTRLAAKVLGVPVALVSNRRRASPVLQERRERRLAERGPRLVGMTFQDFADRVAPLLADPRSVVDRLAAAPPAGAVEFVFVRPRRRAFRRVWTPVVLDQGLCTLATWHDVTAERDLLAERERQLLANALTGVPNRRAAEVALGAEIERMKRYGTQLCVADERLYDAKHAGRNRISS